MCRKTDDLPDGADVVEVVRPQRGAAAGVSPRLLPAVTLAGIVLAAVALWGTLGQQLDVPDRLRRRAHPLGRVALARGRRWALGARRRLRVRPALSRAARPCASAGVDGSGRPIGGRGCWTRSSRARRVPAFFLARRLLPPGWSLACAALTVAVPSALYTGFVMTESVAYAACVLAFLAIARCLERPSSAHNSSRWAQSASQPGPVPARGARGRARDRARATRPVDAARRPAASCAALAPHRCARGRCGGARRARRARQPTRGLRRPLALLRSGGGRALDVARVRRPGALSRPRARSWSRPRLSESSGARAEQAIERPRRSSRCS